MTKTHTTKPLASIGGKTLEDWDGRWQRLEGGFGVPHAEVYAKIGLYRAVLRGDVVFIGCAVELNRRLQQLRSPKDLVTNNHHAALKIREHMEVLHLEVLLLEDPAAKLHVNALKSAMIREHRPRWNAPRAAARKPRK